MPRRYDPYRWIAHQLPPILRRRLLYAMLMALVYPVRTLFNTFYSYASGIEGQLSYNALTIYLEKYLNDLFFFTDNEIYIVDYIGEATLYLAHRDEDKTTDYFSLMSEGKNPVYVSTTDALVGGFTVMVPEVIATAENLSVISRWVNYYKYAGTQFNIKTY